MTRTVYLNGEYLPEDQAKVSIFDRGLLFADGVYEVMGVLDGKLVDFDGHVVRLERSLRELEMGMPLTGGEIREVQRQIIQRNGPRRGPGLHAGEPWNRRPGFCLGRRPRPDGLHVPPGKAA